MKKPKAILCASALVLLLGGLCGSARGRAPGAVTGRVVSPAGEPIEGAELVLAEVRGHRTPGTYYPWHPALSGKSGAFSVPVFELGDFCLWVMADGWKTAAVRVPRLLPWLGRRVGDVRLAPDPHAKGKACFRFQGPGGRPWAGKTVEIRLERKGNYRRRDLRARTDARGFVPAMALAPGMWVGRVLPLGAKKEEIYGFTVKAGEPAAQVVDLEPCCTVQGRVLDPEGRPVPWAQVGSIPAGKMVEERTPGYSEFRYFAGFCSMGDGTYRRELGADTRRLCAWSRGYGVGRSPVLSLAAGQGLEGVDIALPPLAVKPGWGCIRLDASEPGGLFIGHGHVSTRVTAVGSRETDYGYAHPDMEGRFCFYWLRPGTYRVQVETCCGYGELRATATVAAGEIADVPCSGKLVCELSGRVLAPDGRPVEGAFFHWDRGERTRGRPPYRSREDGSFLLQGLRPGVRNVTAYRKGLGWCLLKGVRLAATGTEPATFRLQPWFTVRGRVVDQAGAPVAGARVSARGVPKQIPRFRGHRVVWGPTPYTEVFGNERNRFDPIVPATTGQDGHFLVGGLLHGEHWLNVEHEEFEPGFKSFAIDLVQDASVGDIVIERIFTGFGTVVVAVADEQGAPLSGVKVSAKVGPKHFYGKKTGVDGRLVLGRVPAGLEGWAIVRSEGLAPDRKSGWTVGQGDTLALDFRLGSGGTIEGVVLGPDGAPLAGQEVVIKGGKCDSYCEPDTDENGRFVAPHLAAGGYRVYVRRTGVRYPPLGPGSHTWVQVRRVALEPGATVRVDFDLQERGALEGHIDLGRAKAFGEAPLHAKLLTADSYRYGPEAGLNGDGSFRMACVAPGRYVLEVRAGGSSVYHCSDRLWFKYRFKGSVEVRRDETQRVSRALPRGGPVRGRLKKEDEKAAADDGRAGEPLPRIHFYVEGGSCQFWGWTRKGGSFAIPYLPAGDYELFLSYESDYEAVAETVKFTVTAGKDLKELVIPVRKE